MWRIQKKKKNKHTTIHIHRRSTNVYCVCIHIYIHHTDFCFVYIVIIAGGRASKQRVHSIQRIEASCGGRETKNWRAFFYRTRFSITSWDPDRFGRSVGICRIQRTKARYIYSIEVYSLEIVNRKMPLINGTSSNFFFTSSPLSMMMLTVYLPLLRHVVCIYMYRKHRIQTRVAVDSTFSHFFLSTMIQEIFSGVVLASVFV